MENKAHTFTWKTNHTLYVYRSFGYIKVNVPENNRDDDVWRAQMRQVTFRRHNLDNRWASKMLMHIFRHLHWHHVLGALQYVAWDFDQRQNMSSVTLEFYLG